jgi:hypothetical protein
MDTIASSMGTAWVIRDLLLALGTLAAAAVVAGCGGGSSSTGDTIQAQLDQARREGAVAAHRRERMAELQRRVARLERRSREGAGTPAAAPPVTETADASAESSVLRLFHAPSGNVSCAILTDGATCSVVSANETFVLENGIPAWTESGLAFSGESGEAAAYGSTIGVGQVSCSIPAADEQRGVTCVDSGSDHGFEASRHESRQHTF